MSPALPKRMHLRAAAMIAVMLLLLLLALRVVMVAASPQHLSGGCNHIPLVGGQPAYSCAITPRR